MASVKGSNSFVQYKNGFTSPKPGNLIITRCLQKETFRKLAWDSDDGGERLSFNFDALSVRFCSHVWEALLNSVAKICCFSVTRQLRATFCTHIHTIFLPCTCVWVHIPIYFALATSWVHAQLGLLTNFVLLCPITIKEFWFCFWRITRASRKSSSPAASIRIRTGFITNSILTYKECALVVKK